jgi:hypothetical protein
MNTNNTKNERPLFPHQIHGQDVWKIGNEELVAGYALVFNHYTDQELVDEFNTFTGHCYQSIWVQAMRAALISEIENRNIDTSAIVTKINGEVHSVSYARAMKLVTTELGKKLVGVGNSHLPKFKDHEKGKKWFD